MSDAIGWIIGVIILLIGAWWAISIGWSLIQDLAWSRKYRHLERVSPADLRLDPRWGPPFDTTRTSHEAWIRGGPIEGMPSLLFAHSYPVGDRHGAVVVCAARFRSELPRLEVRRRDGIALPAMGLPPIPTGDRSFDEVYEVTAENVRLVRDLLTPPLRHMMLETRVPVVRIAGQHLLLLEDGSMPKPGPVLDALVTRFGLLLRTLPAPLAALR